MTVQRPGTEGSNNPPGHWRAPRVQIAASLFGALANGVRCLLCWLDKS